ncbi:MAG TPA: sugar phosphate isomerase/epimerase family protein [Tepidisphaeraceae bacterium]|jgi:sugar phosphate isomerase/epimerase|nr:sugar phosphate isomerase/epimerase family protein [Tepidisphaeraceae bacterium]
MCRDETPKSFDLSRCAIHTQTNKPWTLAECIAGYRSIGVNAISVWRHALEPMGARQAGRMLRDAGMVVPALVRGGFFPGKRPADRQGAIDMNRVCIDEAREIGAEMIVLVVGAVPGQPLEEGRKQVAEGIAAILDDALAANVKLAIEPLHPMYAADKSCVNRMAEARAVCERLDHPMLGIAVDAYHVWWDPELRSQIEWAGKHEKLFGFHVCDWRADTRHLLTDRGLMGDGCIDLRTIRAWVKGAGFDGYNEVEVFSEHYWAMDQREYLTLIRDRYLQHV